MNMDYALNEALKYTTSPDTPGVILAYDINCQYSINLRRRLADGTYLDSHEDLPILPAIGLFHVHGHQESCYARYAPTFIRGMGKGDGEILETNWSVLNGISSMARTMTLAHRSEVMDAHIGDNNWKKMINMGKFHPASVLPGHSNIEQVILDSDISVCALEKDLLNEVRTRRGF
jgi:Kyakuja-Dileera-Zisupton transposase